jgi:hypothetical protein
MQALTPAAAAAAVAAAIVLRHHDAAPPAVNQLWLLIAITAAGDTRVHKSQPNTAVPLQYCCASPSDGRIKAHNILY